MSEKTDEFLFEGTSMVEDIHDALFHGPSEHPGGRATAHQVGHDRYHAEPHGSVGLVRPVHPDGGRFRIHREHIPGMERDQQL